MDMSRRAVIRATIGMPLVRGFVAEAANLPELRKPNDSVYPAPSEIGRLLARAPGPAAETHWREYSVDATVTLLGIPLGSKTHVGSGYARVETAPTAQGNMVAIRFAAGSWPESARGLNRVGYIEEVVSEQGVGAPAACAYFAFMTASEEKNLEQARKALESSRRDAVFHRMCAGHSGRFASRLTRLRLPSTLTWRNLADWCTFRERPAAPIRGPGVLNAMPLLRPPSCTRFETRSQARNARPSRRWFTTASNID